MVSQMVSTVQGAEGTGHAPEVLHRNGNKHSPADRRSPVRKAPKRKPRQKPKARTVHVQAKIEPKKVRIAISIVGVHG